jgi:acyl dehydratase
VAVREDWRGRFYEDFEVGDVCEHPLGRTVTTTDNIWFTLLTQNTAPVHFDHHYAAQVAETVLFLCNLHWLRSGHLRVKTPPRGSCTAGTRTRTARCLFSLC